MKVLVLVLMIVFIVVPCQATEIYNVQFADNNGVYTGNENFVVCTIDMSTEKDLVSTLLVDMNNGIFKLIEVNGVKSSDKKWEKVGNGLFDNIVDYVKVNHDSILQSSRNNPQSAYRVN